MYLRKFKRSAIPEKRLKIRPIPAYVNETTVLFIK
jgi:hypothetical protein